MKKSFKFYIIIWAILLAIYNLTVFFVKPIIPGYVINYDARFWISWGIIIATYLGQLVCAKIAFDSKNYEKFFLNIPLIAQSYFALIFVTIAGSALMLIPDCPAWIAVIVCAAVFGLSVIAVIKATVAVDLVSKTDDRVKAKTAFIKMLTVDAESLMNTTKSAELKTLAQKVYEAVRYSDPMSHAVLVEVEEKIQNGFSNFENAVTGEDFELASSTADELLSLIDIRNKKCKLLK